MTLFNFSHIRSFIISTYRICYWKAAFTSVYLLSFRITFIGGHTTADTTMSGWQRINQEVSEEWWEKAYKLFVANDPLRVILSHVGYCLSGDKWNDYGFSCETLLPPAAAGFFKGVDKRAILVVISRRRLMDFQNWKQLRGKIPEPEDPDSNDMSVINHVISQLYNEDGSPRPFNRE